MHTMTQDLVAPDSAPATAPATPPPPRGELVFFFGTMAAGKSTLGLQMLHNRSSRGLRGLTFVRGDREGTGPLRGRLPRTLARAPRLA